MKVRDHIPQNDFQRLIQAVQSADEKRIEDETCRIARAVLASKPIIRRTRGKESR
jgi:hypothetical protein